MIEAISKLIQVCECPISGNAGCTTGTPEATFNYWKTSAAQLATVFNQTYSCTVDPSDAIVKTTGFVYAPINDPGAMVAQLQEGPLAVGIAANQFTF